MKKPSKYTLFLSSCFLLWTVVLQGQSIGVTLPTLPPPNNIVFNTYNELMTGDMQQNRVTFAVRCCGLLGTTLSNWSVTVHASSSYFEYQNESIPVEHASIQFSDVSGNSNMAPANQNPIPLSTSETTLISGRPPLQAFLGLLTLNYRYNFIVNGGNEFLKPDGHYSVDLVFTLRDGNNSPISTYTLPGLGFQISAGNILEYTTIALQNGADDIDFVLDSPSDYLNGASVSVSDGLRVESTQPHEILVKTHDAQLISQTTSHTIPVSKFQIEATSPSPDGIITEPATPLSPNETLLLTNYRDPGVTFLFAQTLEYDLEYSLPAGSADQGLGPPATYSTQVYFIVIPQ